METYSLMLLVFALGVRHGLDADHLAYIDGLARYNWREKSPIARWVGTLFSFGHGMVVVCIAAILGLISPTFRYPDSFDAIGTWVSIASLFLIGTLNVCNLLKAPASESFQLAGLKAKFFSKLISETTNPFVVILSGALFALAADTVSQTSVWALAAGNSSSGMPLLLGLIFLFGMMLTDTIDSLIAYRLITSTSQLGRSASRGMGWVIVVLAYGVSLYEALTFFFPETEMDFEIVGAGLFLVLLGCYFVLALRSKSQARSA